ncbi:MAG: hypothetical protein GC180_00860 [Bacteroidetes bacterium]|nr:hypothetical protein [Bacteroidota bacterium]
MMTRIFRKDPKSQIALLVSVLAIVILRLVIADPGNSLTWDVFGYYLYLPAYFIYDDLTLQDMTWVNHIIDTYHTTGTLYQAVQIDGGNWVMRYPGGLALLNLPYFTVADLLAEPMGYARDGFSLPYQFAWVFGSMCYAIIGLFLSRKLLLRYFSDGWTALLLLILVFTTNYLEMATFGNPLAHNFLFFLIAVALYIIDSWKEKIHWIQMLALGLVIGLITMSRPNEGLFILVPLIWKFGPFGRSQYFSFLGKQLPTLFAGAIGLLIGGLPQMLYWKWSSGQWLFYSYQDNGVGFDFMSPHTWDFLFSFRKGWFIYTPVMLFAVLGFVQMYKKNKELFWSFFLFFILNLYIVSSWTVWWYGGGSYSSRSMVSSYLMLLFPLGYFLVWLKERQGLWQSFLVLLAGLTVLNLFQFWQFKAKIIDGERMTAAYYWKIFGRTSIPDGAKNLLLVERQAEAHEHMPLERNHLDSSILFETWLGTTTDQENQTRIQLIPDEFEAVVQLDEEHPYTRAFETGYSDITRKEYAWLKIEADIYVPDSVGPEAPMLVANFLYKGKPYKYTTTEYLIPQLKRGEWQHISMDYMTPEVRNKADRLKAYLWYRGKGPVYARSMKITRYEPK